MTTQELSTVSCPNCGFRYNTPVTTIIDVGQSPQLRLVEEERLPFLRLVTQVNQG